jgi:ribonuclease HI
MDPKTVIAQLQAYELRHAGKDDAKSKFAGVTWRWLDAELACGQNSVAELLAGPLISDIILDAAMEVACGWTPEWAAAVERRSSASISAELRPPCADATIYCDGCCLNNGKPGAVAGYGLVVYDAKGAEVCRVSKRLPPSEPQTNQRAELRALLHALTYISDKEYESVEIYTDSKYAINCVTKWSSGWEAAGWRKADGKPVLHVDLIRPCVEYLTTYGGNVCLYHVEAHTGGTDVRSRGNAIADMLARDGAQVPSAGSNVVSFV